MTNTKYQLKKLENVPKKEQILHAIPLFIEMALSGACLGLLIYNIAIGDPNNRMLSCLGATLCFLLPLLVEVIFKARFSFATHMIVDVYLVYNVLCGNALNYFKTVGPFDEIGHFMFGYFSALFFFYMFMANAHTKKLSPMRSACLLFLLSMSVASLWEILEFSVDLFLNQNSLGYPTAEWLAEAEAQGLTGFNLAVAKLKYNVSVWDTITDMALHLGGTTLFTIQYIIYRHVKQPIILGWIEKDYYRNKEAFYELVPDTSSDNENTDQVEAEIIEDTDDIDNDNTRTYVEETITNLGDDDVIVTYSQTEITIDPDKE